MKLISLVVPIYNEEENIPLLWQEVLPVFASLKNEYDFEVLFVDDGSLDRGLAVIEDLAKNDLRIKYLSFSRNFGKEMATTAGLRSANGAAVILLDADLQHPPEMIPEFLRRWEAGSEMVIGVRQNEENSFLKKIGSQIFYRIINWIGEARITPQATDFRLIDRRLVEEFNRLGEHLRMTRGLLAWLGFKKEFVPFKARPRQFGAPGYSWPKLIRLALSSFVSLSLIPLKIAGYLGCFITFAAGGLGLFLLITQYIFERRVLNFSGMAELGILIIFLVGIILSSLGLIALYIANIHHEVQGRPLYIVRKKNFPD
jgi:dolichol-phosphate mannosyltransferase